MPQDVQPTLIGGGVHKSSCPHVPTIRENPVYLIPKTMGNPVSGRKNSNLNGVLTLVSSKKF